MNFDYIHDLFGKHRRQASRFSAIEKQAIGLLQQFVDGAIDEPAFDEAFTAVRQTFMEMLKSGDGNSYTIDEDTPLWLNLFIANHFLRWQQFHQLRRYIGRHPELLDDENFRQRYEAICHQDIDRKFREACLLCLQETGEKKEKA